MTRKIVTLWVDEDLMAAIDELAESMGYRNKDDSPNRSATIRHVLRRAVGTPGTSSVLEEEVLAVHRRLRERAGVIAERVREVLVEELGE